MRIAKWCKKESDVKESVLKWGGNEDKETNEETSEGVEVDNGEGVVNGELYVTKENNETSLRGLDERNTSASDIP